ncbi:1 protease [Chlorella sorokiniana]|uniref:1 protease n=1 Tax=Chlorella sorokiniana TaxID=3076 RepID=A0A2P6TGM1_CHLSO|nr:1 protease [Chlorella sorokiniana]|eukprot:PRW33246.1 1 protease [Chlorella sorokiniana]
MATREVPTHPVEAEEQKESKGFLGKVKASGSSPAEADTLFGGSSGGATEETHASASEQVHEKVETAAGPSTPSRGGPVCAPSEETTDAWKRAEAETVRAEHAAKRAEEVACEADRLAAEAAAAKGLTTDAARKAEELRQQQAGLEEEARRRAQEARDLDRQLEHARRAAKVAERRRVEILEESKRIALPAKELTDEADRLAREADAMRSRAMELEREMEKLRTGRPMQARCGHAVHAAGSEAAKREEEAQRLRAEVGDLSQQAGAQEADAKRKQGEAEAMMEVGC